ncbi:RNA-binding domain-containing protein [Cystobasidium minutum MCA 4210]|uniref:RNA-binding domain-containing protein n=1 Tax=Cystobasidium minutum MCA 4210 TaxID=1397322 RepID=UPI0034CF4003|eukprot:jgi/Rhomi1/59413/CE59412_2115
MSFRPIGTGSSNSSASLPAKPASPASPPANGEQAATPSTASSSVQGPQIPAQLQQSSNNANNYYPGYTPTGAAAASYSPTTGYTSTAVAGPSYDPTAQAAAAAAGYTAYPSYTGAYPGYDAYSGAYGAAASGYDYAASGYGYGAASTSAGPSGYHLTDEELAAQQSAYNPENVQQQESKPKKVKGQARTTVLRKAADTVYEDATLMEWDPKHYRIFVGNLGNDVNDEDLVKAFEGYPSFVKAKVVRDKVTGKTRGYGFVAYSDPQDFMAAWKKMDGRYVGSRPVKIQKATTQVRGAINPTGAWKPYIRR